MDKLKGLASKLGSGHSSGSNATGSSDPTATNTSAGVDPTAQAAGQNTQAGGAATTSNQGDFLDRGVGMAGQRFGHNLDRQQEEKISDGIRSGYTKATGSNIPIKDQN